MTRGCLRSFVRTSYFWTTEKDTQKGRSLSVFPVSAGKAGVGISLDFIFCVVKRCLAAVVGYVWDPHAHGQGCGELETGPSAVLLREAGGRGG